MKPELHIGQMFVNYQECGAYDGTDELLPGNTITLPPGARFVITEMDSDFIIIRTVNDQALWRRLSITGWDLVEMWLRPLTPLEQLAECAE